MKLPPLLQSRNVLFQGMKRLLPQANQPESPQNVQEKEQKIGVCNIVFAKKRALSHSPRESQLIHQNKNRKNSNFGDRTMISNETLTSAKFNTFQPGQKNPGETLRATKPKLAYPSFQSNNLKRNNNKDGDIQEIMSHFSVNQGGNQQDPLLLTLQKSKSKLLED